MEIQGNLLEEFGFKANAKGFFTEWQGVMSTIHKEHLIGNDFSSGQKPQLVVDGNHWFAASITSSSLIDPPG